MFTKLCARSYGHLLLFLAACVLPAFSTVQAASQQLPSEASALERPRESSASIDAPRQRKNQITIDAGVLTASVSYARGRGGAWLLGGGAGVSGDFLGFMLLGGRHYAEHNGWSYEEKDGFEDKSLIDIVHARLFARFAPANWLETDFGVRGSVFLHFDSSDDDAGSGLSAGVYVNPMFGWRAVKFGPAVIIGGFWGCRDASEFGVFVSPLSMRVAFSW